MGFSIINSEPDKADAVFVAANNDISSSFGKGADKGPAAVRGCLDRQIEFLEPRTGLVAVDMLKIGWLDLGDLNGDRTPAALGRAIQEVTAACAGICAARRFPLLIGGDHSNSIGALAAVGTVFPPERTTVLHIDAHHDLRMDDVDCNAVPFGPLAHCCAMRHAVMAGCRLVQVGVRAYSREEEVFVRDHRRQIDVFRWGMESSFKIPPPAAVVDSIKTDCVYVSMDVDGFDPSVMPGTGTPVSGGLGWWYGWDLLQAVCGRKNVIGADICEVAPRPPDGLTEYNAAQLAYNLVTWALLAGTKISSSHR